MKRKSLVLLLALVLVLTFGAGCSPKSTDVGSSEGESSSADAYPTKPITLNLGFSAGGSSDVMVRILAATMEKYIGQPVVVVNKPGAGGWVAWEELAKSVKPDGYTFSLVNSPNISLGAYDEVNPREFTLDDFDLLANHVTDYSVIVIRNDETRYTDLESLIEYAKENTLLSACSATGIISDDATVTERFNMEYGTNFEIIQTGGAKESETMFISKDSDVLVANIADIFTGHRNGDYKVIAQFAPERSEIISDVPTAEELGFGEMYGFSARGYALPKGVDPAIREKLLDALKKSIEDPAVKDKLLELGAQTHFLEGEEYRKFLDENIETAKKIYNVE